MAVTITEYRKKNIGSMKQMSGRFTDSGGSGDIVTGLRRVHFVSMTGVDTSDNQVRFHRNTISTGTDSDEARDAMGTVSYSAANSGSIYKFRAMGV